MVDVRAHREAFRFQAGSAATITVTAANADGDPVDLTSHTLTLTPNGETPIAATTADPEAGTRVFSFDADDTALLDDAGKGSISLADGDGDEWIVGSAWASTVGTTSQDHEVSVVLGSANIAVTVAAYIGAGGGGGTGLPDGGTTGQVPYISDAEGTVAYLSPNSANGYARLDGDGTVPDNRIPSTIARDTEVTNAIAAAVADKVTLAEALEGLRENFQRSDVHVTLEDEFVMDDHDRIVITAGSQVTLPPAESMGGQEVTVYGTSQEVLILPASGETVLGQPSFTLPAPPGAGGSNSVKFVAVDASAFGVGWSWAQTLRQGPAWDVPDWDGVGEGRILATSDSPSGQLAYIPAGTSGQVMMWRPFSGPDEAPSPGFVDVSELDVQSEDVAFTGTGLFVGTPDVNGGLQRAEGTLDRWMFVSAFATTNVDLSSLMGPSEVVTQPTLDGGAVPIRGSDVWLFGQTNPAENGAYLVGFDDTDGIWVKYEHPAVFDPPGNGYRVTCNADGTDVDGVTFMWVDDDRTKSRRAAVNGDEGMPYEPSASGRWVRFGPPSEDLTTDPSSGGTGGGEAYGQDEGSTSTATTLTSLLDAALDLGSLAAGDVIRGTVAVSHANSSGGSVTHQLGVYLNGTQVAVFTAPSLANGTRTGIADFVIRAQSLTDVNGALWGQYPSGQPPLAAGQATVSDLSAGCTVDVYGAVAGANQSLTVQFVTAEKIPA